MPISLIVFSFISVLGALAGVVLLATYLGLFEAANPVMVWLLFLVFSALGPSGVMMSARQSGRLLIALGATFTALGLVAVGVIFASSLSVALSSAPTLPLVVFALLALPGGLGLIVAGRASGVQE